MYEKIMAEKNKILEIKSGSHLYGLETPFSDLDYLGIFIPDVDYVLGFKKCEEVDLSIKSKLENGKNSKDAIDRKMYNFQKYIKLALDNNPNILETLFVNEDKIVFKNELGNRLLSIKHRFPHKGLVKKFIAYAISQKKLMLIKKDTFDRMENAVEFLLKQESGLLLPLLEENHEFNKLFKYTNKTDEHYHVGDMIIVKNQTVKRAIFEIEKRIGEKTNRKELIKTHGFDTKFSSHLIRLLLEGKQFLETGELNFPLKERDFILNIKQGNIKLEEVLSLSEKIEKDIRVLELSSTKLREYPDTEYIEKFLVETLKDYFNFK